MKITLIDNYDSFTWNLVHYIGGQEIGGVRPEVEVIRNDKTTADAVIASDPDAIVLSPGPCTPNEAGICLDLIGKASAQAQIPMFGVCLGHQAMGQVFGGHVVRAPKPMHGKMSTIAHIPSRSVFRGHANGDFQATRYHSLVVDRAGCPPDLESHRRIRGRRGRMGLMHQLAARCTGCSSTPRASPRSTATA